MSSDWPSALETNQIYSSEHSPAEIQSPQKSDSTEVIHQNFVHTETAGLVAKVKLLQNSYDDYLTAQQVVIFVFI